MPGNSRRLPRTARTSMPATIPLIPGETMNSRYSALGAAIPTLPGLETPSAPKHIPFPNTPVDSDLNFELMMFGFTFTAASLQFLNMYRTVWWLPNSYTHEAMNFYLIDLNLLVFISMILARRILYLMGCKLVNRFFPPKLQEFGCMCYRLFLFGLIFSVLFSSAYYVIQNNTFVNIFYLCYPVIVYLIIYGFSIMPFFDHLNWNCEDPPPYHACTSNASEIRMEVENLKTNFNNRLKQILFCSVFNAYYAGLVPCCFAQNYLYYDVYWAGQHIVIIFLSSFSSYYTQIVPLSYCDTLHRATLHLGGWGRVETRSVLPAAYTWQDDMLWPLGALVRHGREMYRAQGDTNAAEPGNTTYSRFYAIFKNPSVVWGSILGFQMCLVIGQLFILIFRCVFWHHIITITFLIFYNYYTTFKVMRDYLISVKIYKLESALREKINLN